MDRTKLLMVINSLAGGGAERQFVETVNRLDPDRFDVSVCLTCRKGVHLDKLRTERLAEFECLSKRGKLDLFRLGYALRKVVRKIRPDIVHGWLSYSNLLIQPAAWGLGCRTVAAVRNSPKAAKKGTGLESLFHRWEFRMGNRGADVILANSDSVASELVSRGYQADRVRFIPNGLDRSGILSAASALEAELEGDPALLAVGRLAPQKGYPLLLQAVQELRSDYPNLVLSVAGTGPLRTRLEQTAEELNISHAVRWLGFRHDIYGLMSAADVFVLSSHYEGMPNVIMEAMVLGRPIVATAVDGVNELLDDGQSAILVDPGRVDALVSGLNTVLQKPNLADTIATTAARRSRRYDFARVIPRYESLYQALLNS